MPNPKGLDDDVVNVTITDVTESTPVPVELELPKKEDDR